MNDSPLYSRYESPLRMNEAEGRALAAITRHLNGYTPAELDELAGELMWQTQGVDGTGEPRVVPLNTLAMDHLENIMVTQKHVSPLTRKVIMHLIKKGLV